MESLKRLREPAAFVLAVALGLQLLADVIIFAVAGTKTDDSVSPVSLAIVTRALDPLLILVLALVVASCVLGERTRHARVITLLALLGSILTVLTGGTLGVVALAADFTVVELTELLVSLVVPVLVIVGLVQLLRLQSAAPPAPAQAPAIEDGPSADLSPPALSHPHQPVWQPDAASGVAWHTAGDAALGAPASGWGTPGESGGWAPLSDEEDSGGAGGTGHEA